MSVTGEFPSIPPETVPSASRDAVRPLFHPTRAAGVDLLRRLAAVVRDHESLEIRCSDGVRATVKIPPETRESLSVWLRILSDMLQGYETVDAFLGRFPEDLLLSRRRNPSNLRQYQAFFRLSEGAPHGVAFLFPVAGDLPASLPVLVSEGASFLPLSLVLDSLS